MNQAPDITVIVRRRWNDPRSARVPLSALRELVNKNDPGGVCGPIPRSFLFARVWCDKLVDGQSLHACDPVTAPHELELCIIERDNGVDVNAQVRALLRSQSR